MEKNPHSLSINFDESFGIARLGELNEVLAASEGNFKGNWFYPSGSTPLNKVELAAAYAPFRANLALACRNARRVLELGVRGGHAALMAMEANPQLEWHSIEPCNFQYDLDAVQWLSRHFEPRFQFFTGESVHILPEMRIRWAGVKYDVIIIDGRRPLEAVRTDLYNALTFAEPSTWVVIDAENHADTGDFLDKCVDEGLLLNTRPFGWQLVSGQLCAKVSPLLARCFP